MEHNYGYLVVLLDIDGNIKDTPYASYDINKAQEVALQYAYDWLYENWFCRVHTYGGLANGFVSMIYEGRLVDAPVEVRRIRGYE